MRQEQLWKRPLYWLVMVFFIGVLAVTCTACTKASGASVALKETLQAVQGKNSDVAGELLEAVWFYPEDYGVSRARFVKQYFDGFIYNIGKTSSRDTTVSIEFTVSVRDIDEVLATLETARDDAIKAGADTAQGGYADAALMAACEASPWKSQEVSATIVMNQDNNKAWQVDDKSLLAAVLLNGYNLRQEMA